MATLFGKSKRKRQAREDPRQPPGDDSDRQGTLRSKGTAEERLPHPSSGNVEDDEEQEVPSWASFDDLGLAEPLVATCRTLGFRRPTAVQRAVIPFLLKNDRSHILALAATGSGKTASFVLPMLHRLAPDPYGIFAVVLSPTRELAKQIHQQVLALGAAYNIRSALVVGGLDAVRQSLELDRRPHFCVATPGRLAELLRGPKPPSLKHIRYMVLDEADRLLKSNSGFERDVAELLLHCTAASTVMRGNKEATTTTTTTTTATSRRREPCQTLLFSATMTRSLESLEEMAGAGLGRLPLRRFLIREDGVEENVAKKPKTGESKDDDDDAPQKATPRIPAGLKQEYIFMPSRVRDAYLLTAIRALISDGGITPKDPSKGSGWTATSKQINVEDEEEVNKARSAIVFVSTCERAAFVSELLSQVGVENVALHSMLSQNRRLASLAKFKSQQVRVMVATDVGSRGLDIPTVDLVLNSELPRSPIAYVHRVGRTARAGRRGRAVSLVSEAEVSLVHAAESVSGRSLEKCTDVTDDMAIKLLGPVAKAARLTKLKLNEIGFDELAKKFKERKARDRKERERIDRALRKQSKKR